MDGCTLRIIFWLPCESDLILQRMKAEGKDFLNPVFSDEPPATGGPIPIAPEQKIEVRMTKPGVDRKITPEEVKAQDKEKPWVRLRCPYTGFS